MTAAAPIAAPRRGDAARPHRLLRCRSGAGAVEFALTAPVLLLLVAGITELGRFIYTGDALANAIREAARRASVRGAASGSPMTSDAIRDYVRTRAAILAAPDLAVTVTFDPDNAPGSVVTIEARYPLTFVVPPFNAMGPVTVARSTSYTISN